MNELMQNTTSKWFETQFPPISLEELNGKAAMLSRIDNKYVVDKSSLKNLIPDLSNHFDILEIDGRRAFTYNTRYFDDQDCSAYYEHHQGLRKGFKVRVRRYVESDLCYLEVKVKGQRGMTVKHRMPYPEAESAALTFEAREFAKTIYSGHYGKPFNYDLHRALDVQYRRITLVAHEGGERMTIDTDLKFHFGEKEISLGNDIFIVETKSKLGRGYADICLRKTQNRPAKKCSKYCVGMASLGLVQRHNLFLPTMRKLGISPNSALEEIEVPRAA